MTNQKMPEFQASFSYAKSISPKGNVIVKWGFKLAYYDIPVQYIYHNASLPCTELNNYVKSSQNQKNKTLVDMFYSNYISM